MDKPKIYTASGFEQQQKIILTMAPIFFTFFFAPPQFNAAAHSGSYLPRLRSDGKAPSRLLSLFFLNQIGCRILVFLFSF